MVTLAKVTQSYAANSSQSNPGSGWRTKEDIGIEQQLYEIVMGKNFALNCLS